MKRLVLALGLLLTGPLSAQSPQEQAPALLVADDLQITPDRRLIASGNVEALYEGRRLRARQIIYDHETETLTIEGPITLQDGSTADCDICVIELGGTVGDMESMPFMEALRQMRALVLRAEGQHFSSGGDIRGFLEASPEHVSKLAWNVAAAERCSKPVIVANRGYTFGVGFELSLACDFRIVGESCRYALPEQNLGQIPGSGGSARLQKMIGIARTKHMVMRSKRIPGATALDWGIAIECVPDAELEAATDALVDELRRFSPLAQRTAKRLINDGENSPLSVAIEMEGHCYARLRTSDDFREGVEAFGEKRKAAFRGS